MLINKFLEKVFSAPSNVTVLRILNERVTGLTGRETARLAGITHRSALKTLSTLESLKIVKRQTGGRDYLFTLNRNNYIAQNIITKIFENEQQFFFKIKSLIKKRIGKYSTSLIIFGSVARKEEKIDSDLDLCIVFQKDKNILAEKVHLLADDLMEYFSVHLAPFYISKSEFKRRAKIGKAPIKDVIENGIVISGKPINILIHG